MDNGMEKITVAADMKNIPIPVNEGEIGLDAAQQGEVITVEPVKKKIVVVVDEGRLGSDLFDTIDKKYGDEIDLRRFSGSDHDKGADLVFIPFGGNKGFGHVRRMKPFLAKNTILVGLGAPVEPLLGSALKSLQSEFSSLNYVHGEQFNINGFLPVPEMVLRPHKIAQGLSTYFFSCYEEERTGAYVPLRSPLNTNAANVVELFLRKTSANPKKTSTTLRDQIIVSTQLLPFLVAAAWCRVPSVEKYLSGSARKDLGNWIQTMTPDCSYNPQSMAEAAIAYAPMILKSYERFDDSMQILQGMLSENDKGSMFRSSTSGLAKPEKGIFIPKIVDIDQSLVRQGTQPVHALMGVLSSVMLRVMQSASDSLTERLSVHLVVCPEGLDMIRPVWEKQGDVLEMFKKHPKSALELVNGFRNSMSGIVSRIAKGEIEPIVASLEGLQKVSKGLPQLFAPRNG